MRTIRCWLQDNRYHSGREAADPSTAFDEVQIAEAHWAKVFQMGLWLREIDADTVQSVDLFITELLAMLDEQQIPYQL